MGIGRALVVILDGLGDRACPVFGGKTPLGAARTPTMNALVAAGRCGLVDPIAPHVAPATHTGTGVLMGALPGDLARLRRGPIEAAGIGLPHVDASVTIRCNFATLSDDGATIVDRRAGRISDGTEALAAALGEIDVGPGITASLHPGIQHRAVLRLVGERLSAQISNTDPEHLDGDRSAVQHCRPNHADDADARRTADAVNAFLAHARQRLTSHPVNALRAKRGLLPANGLLCRDAGTACELENVLHALNLSVAVVAAEGTVLGLARMFGFAAVTDPRFTATPSTDLPGKVAAAERALVDHDLVFLHVKATDVCAHDRQPIPKRDVIERIDAALSSFANDRCVVAITADHSTDSNTGRHTADPVPSLLYAPAGPSDSCRSFSERICAGGGLENLTGHTFLRATLDAMTR